jgi:hypothetical protein
MTKLRLNILNFSRVKPGSLKPHAHRIEPVLNTFAPAGETKQTASALPLRSTGRTLKLEAASAQS